MVTVGGCYIHVEGCNDATMRAKYERTVRLAAPFPPGRLFAAQTHNGSIAVTGTDAADCNVIATIKARAATEQNAKKLADETKITLAPFGNKLTAKVEKPYLGRGRSISVSFKVAVPNQTGLELTTHNGAIKIANITGNITSTTHNGKITAERISGDTSLHTHNGRIICKELSGNVKLKTHNGKICAAYRKDAPAVCNANIVTHNGNIGFTAPADFSATVDASRHNGSIQTDLPITVIGKITKRQLKGTIGTGEGKLRLKTHNGSIKIK